MGRPFADEMSKLDGTYAAATTVDIGPLRDAVRLAGHSALLAIGSGGSLTAAHVLATLHRRWTGQLAAVATPLEAVFEAMDPSVAVWLISAGGGNVDILSAARTIVSREPRQLSILCGRPDSPLATLAREHSFSDFLTYGSPVGKDGFLATNSLLTFVVVLLRAYEGAFGVELGASEFGDVAKCLFDDRGPIVSAWHSATSPLWSRPTTVVLHDPATRIAAIDLESKFTEAGIGHIQIADYRNFAHGRHHWLAKHGENCGVLALLTPEYRQLAERTVALIPNGLPQGRLMFEGSSSAALLASVVAAFRITGWAGEARGIDPGRPGVPPFGRRLFHLSLARPRRSTRLAMEDREAVAIERKAGLTFSRLVKRSDAERWRSALAAFKHRLHQARFGAVVLDYDGTVVDTRARLLPPTHDMASQLVRLLESGLRVAIASGRGVSVRSDLRKCLPPSLWAQMLVGYYNGAEVAVLLDDAAPDGTPSASEELEALAAALRGHSELAEMAVQSDRRFQITLEARRGVSEARLWDLAHEQVIQQGLPGVRITRSSHSIDIVAPGVSKLNVLARIREMIGDAPALTIGDRGRWPGNDYELLHEPYALSVDETNADLATGWNLAPRGQRGAAVTLAYLRALQMGPGGMRIDEEALA